MQDPMQVRAVLLNHRLFVVLFMEHTILPFCQAFLVQQMQLLVCGLQVTIWLPVALLVIVVLLEAAVKLKALLEMVVVA
jgi:hypothetical protein